MTNKATTQSDVPRLTEEIVYRIPTTDITSGQVSYMTVSSAVEGGYSNTFSYSYDANGNITDVTSGGYLTSYTYDTQNQLIREDNQAAGKSWTYDDAGNILSRSEYAYTTGTLGTALDTVDYVYSTGTWGDLLLTYDGVGITYDEIGNPLTVGSRTYTWKHGRELATLTEDGTTWTYTYNADGLRTKRTDGTTTYQYIYADGQLVKLLIGSRGLNLSYDANGTPMSVYYAGSEYYYVTNIQGDVVAILDYNGVAVVTYTYDAWGDILSIGGAMATTLGEYNPLRYRGYVYDWETGLYYLQSRYYDPGIGRFINADDIALLGASGTVLGYNLFTYCENNPINNKDPSGYAVTPANVIGAVIGTIGGAVIGTAIANYFNLKGWRRWACTAGTTLLLGVVGYFSGPAVYAAIRPAVVKAITTCTIVFSKSQEWVLRALGVAQTYINQALRLVDHNTIRFTKTVLERLANPNRSVPVRILIDCIKSGKASPDPQGTKVIMYTVSNFYRNGTQYDLEVLFDWATMRVMHFKYWR